MSRQREASWRHNWGVWLGNESVVQRNWGLRVRLRVLGRGGKGEKLGFMVLEKERS